MTRQQRFKSHRLCNKANEVFLKGNTSAFYTYQSNIHHLVSHACANVDGEQVYLSIVYIHSINEFSKMSSDTKVIKPQLTHIWTFLRPTS